MLKKLLFQLDTDATPSAFDAVVAYDSEIDHLISYGGMAPENVASTIEGTIFTRAGKNKQYTAIFVGGRNLAQGEALFAAIQKQFFGNFRVSVMLDSNGCNTTAAAAVALIIRHHEVVGKKVVVLAGTGPVGQRAAVLLAKAGAQVCLTSRRLDRAEAICQAMQAQFDVIMTAQEVSNLPSTAAALHGAQIVLAVGAAGVELLPLEMWQNHPTLEVLADFNTVPPSGIGGLKMADNNEVRHGKHCFGGLGIGGLKLRTHRAAISQLFAANDQVFDVEAIYALAKTLVE